MQNSTASATSGPTASAQFTANGVLRGARASALVAIAVTPFGMAFGLAAAEKNLSLELTALMSFVVFAGLSQLAALDLWAANLPVLPILLITLTLNTRHILYGAALAAWARPVPPGPKYATAAVMADINWAMMLQAREKGEPDFGYMLGGGLVLWSIWQVSTVAGFLVGGSIGDPKTFGLDAVVIALFATTLVGLWRGRDDLLPWLAAGSAALVAHTLLPPGWHIIVGAMVGGFVGVLRFAR